MIILHFAVVGKIRGRQMRLGRKSGEALAVKRFTIPCKFPLKIKFLTRQGYFYAGIVVLVKSFSRRHISFLLISDTKILGDSLGKIFAERFLFASWGQVSGVGRVSNRGAVNAVKNRLKIHMKTAIKTHLKNFALTFDRKYGIIYIESRE